MAVKPRAPADARVRRGLPVSQTLFYARQEARAFLSRARIHTAQRHPVELGARRAKREECGADHTPVGPPDQP